MNRFTLIAALTVALVTPALAQAGEDRMVVQLGGVSLSSDQGAEIALRRIRTAARHFCGGYEARTILLVQQHGTCVREMTAKAVGKLDAPKVTAAYGGNRKLVLATRGR